MYLIGVSVALFLAGIFALVLRSELFTGEKMFLTEAQYNQMFTLHGAIMVFLFIIPSIPASLGNFVLPIMLGAKDVAFPRMNLCQLLPVGLWHGFFFLTAMLITAARYRVDLLHPVQHSQPIPRPSCPLPWASSSLVSVRSSRAQLRGDRQHDAAARHDLVQDAAVPVGHLRHGHHPVLATPVLGITVLLLIAEAYLAHWHLRSGLRWRPGAVPALFLVLLAPGGVHHDPAGHGGHQRVDAVYSRKKIFGYSFIALFQRGDRLLGFLVWGHHMFTSGQSALVTVIFSAMTFSVAIPSAVKVFNWLATMYKGIICLVTTACATR